MLLILLHYKVLKGGELVYEGELEGILKIKNSYTGQYLKKMI